MFPKIPRGTKPLDCPENTASGIENKANPTTPSSKSPSSPQRSPQIRTRKRGQQVSGQEINSSQRSPRSDSDCFQSSQPTEIEEVFYDALSSLPDSSLATESTDRVSENRAEKSVVKAPQGEIPLGDDPGASDHSQRAPTAIGPKKHEFAKLLGPMSLVGKIFGTTAGSGTSSPGIAQKKQSSKYSEARSKLIGDMKQIKQHYSTLLAQNWSPDRMDSRYDSAMFPLLLAAEKRRSPDLNLNFLEHGLGDWLSKGNPSKSRPRERLMFVVPGFSAHLVAADVMRDKKSGNISVLIVEPLGFKGKTKNIYEKEALPNLHKLVGHPYLKGKVTLAVLALDTMKSDIGCQIFGLSATSKMAKESRLFEKLHEQNMSGQIKTSKGGDATVLASRDRVKIVDGKGVLPISLFKHSQSKTTLQEFLIENPSAYGNALVNKSGQSLMERYETKNTTRYRNPAKLYYARMAHLNPKIETLRIGTSIESKRITYIDRAIEYLKRASDREMAALKKQLDGDFRLRDVPEPGKLYEERRAQGPLLKP